MTPSISHQKDTVQLITSTTKEKYIIDISHKIKLK